MAAACNEIFVDGISVNDANMFVANPQIRPWPATDALRPHAGDAGPGSGNRFQGIIGRSPALQLVLSHVATVAPTLSTVLIEGETGTGKELIAKAVHNLSPRKDKAFVRFNCAAVPAGLLESELFGHEKGAFTGAVMRKIGRFELADKGTILLDEVGDIPLELQAKLLRVLQEQEFERLGSVHTQRVNVRLVAATNRDLKKMVAEKRFRSDLYFRLNIFPISLPPLRERCEDIPLLVEAFVAECAERMHRRIDVIPESIMAALVRYSWPGNIRELQNFIERSVILSAGPILYAPLENLPCPNVVQRTGMMTLRQAEYDHILNALKATGWIVGGHRGAAERLGMKRSTLVARMRKLGLSRPAYRDS